MPCTISRDEELYYEVEGNKKNFSFDGTDRQLLIAVACYLSKLLTYTQRLEAPKYVQLWLAHHDENDRKRKAEEADQKIKEALQASGKRKLTAAERRALGLD